MEQSGSHSPIPGSGENSGLDFEELKDYLIDGTVSKKPVTVAVDRGQGDENPVLYDTTLEGLFYRNPISGGGKNLASVFEARDPVAGNQTITIKISTCVVPDAHLQVTPGVPKKQYNVKFIAPSDPTTVTLEFNSGTKTWAISTESQGDHKETVYLVPTTINSGTPPRNNVIVGETASANKYVFIIDK